MAGEDIPAHTFLCTYAGEIITSKEYSDREHIMQKSNKKFPFYVYEINNEDLVIDATRFRGVGAYFNHTCSGHNAEVG
jgi:SET domain-containing protein